MTYKVWLIGGTSESARLAKALSQANIPYVVTVVTPPAKALYPTSAEVLVGGLTPEAMQSLVVEHRVGCILDASHPFAAEVSEQAIALSKNALTKNTLSKSALTTATSSSQKATPKVAYLRYERPNLTQVKKERKSIGEQSNPRKTTENVTTVVSIESLIKSGRLNQQRVLLTLGYRNLPKFALLRSHTRLFARVLPSVEAVEGAIAAGFSSSEIIALRPPVSLSVEMALWQQWQISQVVAKASGTAGGEAAKRQAAANLNVELILIQRPSMSYPEQTHSIDAAIVFCRQALQNHLQTYL